MLEPLADRLPVTAGFEVVGGFHRPDAAAMSES